MSEPREPLHLLLAPSDLWRRHGLPNVIMTLGTPLVGLPVVALAATTTFGSVSVVVIAMMVAAPLMNRQILRSALAIVCIHPHPVEETPVH